MFDIGFWELLVVAVIGLLVLGPERLPGAVRTTTLWINRLRRSFTDLKREIEREVGADELKRDLHNQEIMRTLNETRDQLQQDVAETRRQLDDLPYDVNDIVRPQDASQEPQASSKPSAPDQSRHTES